MFSGKVNHDGDWVCLLSSSFPKREFGSTPMLSAKLGYIMITLQIDDLKYYFANKKMLRSAMERYLRFSSDEDDPQETSMKYEQFVKDNIMQFANSAINTKTNEVLKCRMPIESIFDAAAKK